MRAFVISLARRADRLARFNQHVKDTHLDEHFAFETINATDGQTLNLAEVMPRLATIGARQNPRNLSNLPEREIRGILGCALSHLEAWRRVLALSEPAAVFEDDARLSADVSASMVASAMKRLPANADLCWLNDCHYGARGGWRFRARRKLSRYLGPLPRPTRVTFSRMPDIMVATDAYILTPEFARRLREELDNHLGAIDRHMQLFVSRTQSTVYQCYPALFTTDFTDSDTSPREPAS